MVKVAAIAPLDVKENPIAVYSIKLFSSIAERVPVTVLTNKQPEEKVSFRVEVIADSFNPLVFARRTYFKLAELRKEGVRVVHVQWWYRIFHSAFYTAFFSYPISRWMKRLGVKTVVTIHDVPTREAARMCCKDSRIPELCENILSMTQYTMLKRTLAYYSAVIVHNAAMGKVLEKYFDVPPERIFVIPHGVYKPKEVKPLRSRGRVVLTLGFLQKSKHIEKLIKAFWDVVRVKRDRSLKLLIVGPCVDDSDRRYLRKLREIVKGYGIEENVIFIPQFVEDEELDELINSSDVIVFTDTDYFMKTSGVLARVMAFGRPIIATDVPKFSTEIRHEKDGFLFDVGDTYSLTLYLWMLLEDFDMRKKLGGALLEKAKNRYWENIAERHIEVYESLAGR